MNRLDTHREPLYRNDMARSTIVKVNIELGRSLLNTLRRDAFAQNRRYSRQLSHYVQKSLANPPLSILPSETLDDNSGRMTAYFDEPVYNRLVEMKESSGDSFSAIVRACLIHARYLEGVTDERTHQG